MVLGVTGGIAAYKSVQVARDLTRLGAAVDVVMSRSAQEFVKPLSFSGVTGRTVLTELFSVDGAALHIRLGQETDVVCVAPATADFLARAAQGRADDLLTTTLLATRAPVVLCPAMNDRMFGHPQVQANVTHVRDVLGYRIAGPERGALAAGESDGRGRMLEPWQIVEHVGRALAGSGTLSGRTVLVTAGPTREALDAVRFLGNRSSGLQGYALAQAAWRRGADVVLVSGPSALPDPEGVRVVRVESAREMFDAVWEEVPDADVSIFAAAVADYRPDDPVTGKLKRSSVGPNFTVRLTANPDVAGGTRERRREGSVAVGFALETADLLDNARGKLEGKGFDLIVANEALEAESGFEVATNRVTLLTGDGSPAALPVLSKDAVAEAVLDAVDPILAARSAKPGARAPRGTAAKSDDPGSDCP